MLEVLADLLLAAAAVLVVLAIVFRNRRAREILRTLRNAVWLYIAGVLLLGTIEVVRQFV